MKDLQATFPSVLPDPRPPLSLDQAFPGERFGVITADPPWSYANWIDKKNGAAAAHYDCLTLEELKQLPVSSVAAEDCMLFLWTTGPKMNEAIELLEAWGFPFVTVAFVWEKLCRDRQTGGFKPVHGPGWHSAPCCE